MKTLPALLAALLLTVSARADADMAARVTAATGILRVKQNSPRPVPQKILDDAKAVAIISVGRGGFIFGGSHGEGVVITRTRGALGKSWSAPVAFNLSGGSFGAQIGYEKTNCIFILNSDAAVKLFLNADGVKWNAGQASPGPDRADADGEPPAVYIYTQTDGVYGGATVGGSTLRLDRDANLQAYGDPFSVTDIISGKTRRPATAARLYELLNGLVME